jgi:hypothetical protein
MKLFGIILGLFFLGLGVYLTFQAWHDAAKEARIETIAYIGPFIAFMGVFRILRATGAFAGNLVARYAFLGVAILIGMGDRALVKSVYPDATSVSLTSNH